MNGYKTLSAVSVTMIVTLLGSSIAAAEGDGVEANSYHKFRATTIPVATESSIGWSKVRRDSPSDTNVRALVADLQPGDTAEAYTDASINRNTPVGTTRNISFDYRTRSITTTGQVHILLLTSLENLLYLDAANCNRPVTRRWSRSDFTGTTAAGACMIFDNDGVQYTSNGELTALQVYQDVHPGVNIAYSSIVISTTTTLDRIAFGTNRLYNYGPWRHVICKRDESRC